MTNDDPITPEVADVLARWAGLRESAPTERLAEVFEGVRKVMERLYAVDVDGFEFDFVQPDSRER